MNIVVCGSRDFEDFDYFVRKMDKLTEKLDKKKLIIYNGACPTGADRMAQDWATKRRVTYKNFHAAWKELGAKAGPIRNREMLEEAAADGEETGQKVVLVAFFDGDSPGTTSCLAEARRLNIKRVIIDISDM